MLKYICSKQADNKQPTSAQHVTHYQQAIVPELRSRSRIYQYLGCDKKHVCGSAVLGRGDINSQVPELKWFMAVKNGVEEAVTLWRSASQRTRA